MSIEQFPQQEAPQAVVAASVRRRQWTRLLRSWSGILGATILAALTLAVLSSWAGLLPYAPTAQDPLSRLQAPSGAHWFGTDQFGRDLAARTISAVANSLRISVIAVLIAGVIGTLLGLVAGFFRGFADMGVSGLANILFAFPPLLLALALAAVLQRSWFTVAVAISVVYIPMFIRIARSATLAIRDLEFMKAAVSTGQRSLTTMCVHVLPNILPLVVMQVALAMSWAILTEAALSFLGLGTPPPAASLGSLVYDARTTVNIAPWTMIYPGLLTVLLVVSINMIGDALREALDPRGKR